MTPLFRKNPNAYRMLQRMPGAIQKTFTLSQIQALEEALVPRSHALDLRGSLPWLGKGSYFVLLAGPNLRCQPRSSIAAEPSEINQILGSVISVSQACKNLPNAYRLLLRMPKDIGVTFSTAQIKALEGALVPRDHLVSLKLSLPFLGRGAYFVFAAGPDRRARYRNLQNRNPYVFPAVCASTLLGATIVLGLLQLNGTPLLAKPDPEFAPDEDFYPTVVPFKKTRQDCEESHRQWIDDQCIDTLHDPSF